MASTTASCCCCCYFCMDYVYPQFHHDSTTTTTTTKTTDNNVAVVVFCNNHHHSYCDTASSTVSSSSLYSRWNNNQTPPLYSCESVTTSSTTTTISNNRMGPNFRNVPPSTNQAESLASALHRETIILLHYATLPLPWNVSTDDYDDADNNNNNLLNTNPLFNSRDDVRRITNRYMARILLGCYNDTENDDMDRIFLDMTTRPFAIPGSSFFSPVCNRDGDYDFSTIDLLQLLYTSRKHPGSLPEPVFVAIRDKLLSINGTITDSSFLLQCQFELGPIRKNITLKNEMDTENHILQLEISRYLTNQLLVEIFPNNPEFNNTANGNTQWLLEHLATLARNYFFEYNSKPYQAFTINALLVLYDYAIDSDLVTSAELLLDIVTAYSGMQMNHLRRFVPFRRQPKYISETQSYPGDSEFYRLSVLVGNYNFLRGPNYTLPIAIENNISVIADFNLVSTIASKYRLNDFLYHIFFRPDTKNTTTTPESSLSLSSEYFVSSHDAVEMYYSTPKVLISGGGTSALSVLPDITFPNRFCFFRPCLFQGWIIKYIIGGIYKQVDTQLRGWSRPTTIVPSNEPSTDLLDLIRFNGNRNVELMSRGRNLCVAPNFACGLQLEYGNIIDPILNQCSITVKNWTFLDFSGNNNNQMNNCPKYGYYMAVYVRPCRTTQCTSKADNYGLLEIFEDVTELSFTKFRQTILSNNPIPFLSSGKQIYVGMTGETITFDINPLTDDESQIIHIASTNTTDDGGGDDVGNQYMDFRGSYRSWPLAWSMNGAIQSSSSIGRWTFDSNVHRTIYDVSDALHPQRMVSDKPRLKKHKIMDNGPFDQLVHGRYFDDSGSVMANDTVKEIEFTYDLLSVTGFRMVWRNSGLQSSHGLLKEQSTVLYRVADYTFNDDELIIMIGIGRVKLFGTVRINRIRMVTNQNTTMIVGFGKVEQTVYTVNHAIALHGRASEDLLHELGVISLLSS